MTKQRHSIDGFIPRRAQSQLGDQHDKTSNTPLSELGTRQIHSGADSRKSRSLSVSRADITDSLRGIDDPVPEEGKKSRRAKRKLAKKQHPRRRKIIKWVIIGIIVAALAVAGFVALRAFLASNSIFKGSIFDIFQSQPLKQDANGRSNILVLGTSEDDPGHQGGNLTDSMMIISIDQTAKNAYMISVPRDLWVQYKQSCPAGNQGKINAYYSCVGGEGTNIDADRAALTKTAQFVGDIFGMDVQYGVNVNYTVMRDLVNAVGGSITVDIQGSMGAPGVMDANFDWKCGVGNPKISRAQVLLNCPPNGHFIDFKNGPNTLNAEQALYLAQARGDAENIGLSRSNFDREINQQKIIKALREKAMSAGVLSDFGKVTGILDALGNNLRTTFETKEVRTLISLGSDIKDDDIKTIDLNPLPPELPVVQGQNVAGTSAVVPVAGLYDYSGIRALLQKSLSNNPITREGANVTVLNGSGAAGVAQTEGDKLEKAGLIVDRVATAPADNYEDVEIYQIGEGMSATKAKLEQLFSTKVKTTPPPVAAGSGTNFIVIFGKQPSA